MYQYNVDQRRLATLLNHVMTGCQTYGASSRVDDLPVDTAEWVMAPVVDMKASKVAMD